MLQFLHKIVWNGYRRLAGFLLVRLNKPSAQEFTEKLCWLFAFSTFVHGDGCVV